MSDKQLYETIMIAAEQHKDNIPLWCLLLGAAERIKQLSKDTFDE